MNKIKNIKKLIFILAFISTSQIANAQFELVISNNRVPCYTNLSFAIYDNTSTLLVSGTAISGNVYCVNISSIPAICIFTEIGGCGGSFSIPMGQFTQLPLSCLSPGCAGCSCLASPTTFGYIYNMSGSTGCTPGWDLYTMNIN